MFLLKKKWYVVLLFIPSIFFWKKKTKQHILKYGPGWPIGPCSPLLIRPGSILVAHESSGSTHSDPFIWAGPSGRGGLGRADPFDSSTHVCFKFWKFVFRNCIFWKMLFSFIVILVLKGWESVPVSIAQLTGIIHYYMSGMVFESQTPHLFTLKKWILSIKLLDPK